MRTKEERLEATRAKLLWCVHILGPDELVAHESYAAAEKHAAELNDYMHDPANLPDLDVMCLSIVAVWTGSAKDHAAEVVKTKAEQAKVDAARARATHMASEDNTKERT